MRDPVGVRELSLHSLWGDPPDDSAVLASLERLGGFGPVLLSNFGKVYLLAEYIRRFTTEPIRFVVSVSLIAQILDERFDEDVAGGLLQDLGKLLAANIKLQVYPMPEQDVRKA